MKSLPKRIECANLTQYQPGKSVTIAGWVSRFRHHGKIAFLELKDATAAVQVVISPNLIKQNHEQINQITDGYVLEIEGDIKDRPPQNYNPQLKTGEIEIEASAIKILNSGKPSPLKSKYDTVTEKVRLAHRYYDMRDSALGQRLKLRSEVALILRNALAAKGFHEIETPILTRSTPEGARDFIVPSRTTPQNFYALPQSPQIFKQLLMVGGIEKYYQFARCFRDEDLRSDRQPEFTQLDLEMAFINEENVFNLVEELFGELFSKLNLPLKTPFKRLSYQKSLDRYGTDKPDLRFQNELQSLTHLLLDKKNQLEFKALSLPPEISIAPGDQKRLEDLAAKFEVENYTYLKFKSHQSLTDTNLPLNLTAENISDNLKINSNDHLFLAMGPQQNVNLFLGLIRAEFGKKQKLTNNFQFCWITDFPLFEYSTEKERLISLHHPFTSPQEQDLIHLDQNPLQIKARAYDLVLNGFELGGGSIRIHQLPLQQKIFSLLGFTSQKMQQDFGFFLDAFEGGFPPHGGIALGFDRLLMLLTNSETIREVIAFPKMQSGQCPLTFAPTEVSSEQLLELKIRLNKSDRSEQYGKETTTPPS